MIFAVYKPKGLTSNDVLNRLRRAAQTKVVGHAGTLDPLAEGVLVVGIGRESTKQLAKEVAKEKEYRAIIRLGVTSTTDDEEGEKCQWVVSRYPDRTDVEHAVQKFTGTILQRPPIYSAIKLQGKEAYKRARKGEVIVMEQRKVEIKNSIIVSYEWPNLTLNVTTGPGVYIRSLARDIGEELGVGGYLFYLRRTRVGQWTAKEALSLAQAQQKSIEWIH